MSFILFFVALILISTVLASIVYIFKHQKRKHRINKWLKEIGQHGEHRLITTDNALEIMLGQNSFIYKWEILKTAVITKEYIEIETANGNIIIPAKCMEILEYQDLLEIVRNKIL